MDEKLQRLMTILLRGTYTDTELPSYLDSLATLAIREGMAAKKRLEESL